MDPQPQLPDLPLPTPPPNHQRDGRKDPQVKPKPAPATGRSTWHLGAMLMLLVVLLAGYNLVISRNAWKTQRGQLLRTAAQLPLDTEYLFLGNSLVEAGCNPTVFAKAWPQSQAKPKAVNLALGATSPVEQYLILKRAFERPIHPKYLIYGFFDDQLNTPVRGDWVDLVGNRAISYYFPAQAAALYAPGSRLKAWEMGLVSHIPMLVERSSLWAKVERLRRKLEQIGMPRQQFNRFGRVQDFAALEAPDAAAFTRRCATAVRQQAGFSAPIQAIIRLAQTHGTRVILLEMPMPSHHRQTFYSSPAYHQLRAHVQTLARQEQVGYLNASDWVAKDGDFEDAVHLSDAGAAVFSRRLAVELPEVSDNQKQFLKSGIRGPKSETMSQLQSTEGRKPVRE